MRPTETLQGTYEYKDYANDMQNIHIAHSSMNPIDRTEHRNGETALSLIIIAYFVAYQAYKAMVSDLQSIVETNNAREKKNCSSSSSREESPKTDSPEV